jgi:hypothetical protein
MSTLRTAPATGRARRTVATFGDYAEAQRAVDHLSDNGFPVDRVAIVGRGLRYVEQVAGRLTTGRAALAGAAQGSFIGALFGLIASLVFTLDPDPAIFVLVLYGIVAGALFGGFFGAAMHVVTGGERDFTSVSGLTAETFEIQVDEDVADRAAELLRTLGPAGAVG